MEKVEQKRRAIVALDAATINKIAAGEVVESPSSVLKELVENAVDAKARYVRIEARGGGQQILAVHDDGVGIAQEELELTTMRHATSKIRAIDDMRELVTMGFRGEALSSIAAVSRFSVLSRSEGADQAARWSVEGGQQGELCAATRAQGTSIEVRDLFYNVPARLKFQKSVRASSAQLQRTALAMAMSYPHVGFSYDYNGERLFDVEPMPRGSGEWFVDFDSLRHRLGVLFGRHLLEHAYEVQAQPSGSEGAIFTSIAGFLAPAEEGGVQRRGQHLVLNGRYVFSPALAKAVDQSYGQLLPANRRSQFFIYLQVPPDQIDVNVHPQKTQVRLAQESALFRQLYRACARAIQRKELVLPKREQGAPLRQDVSHDAYASLGGELSSHLMQEAPKQSQEPSKTSRKEPSILGPAGPDPVTKFFLPGAIWEEPGAATAYQERFSKAGRGLGGARKEAQRFGSELEDSSCAPSSGTAQEIMAMPLVLSSDDAPSQEERGEEVDFFKSDGSLIEPLCIWKQWALWDFEQLSKSAQRFFLAVAPLPSKRRALPTEGGALALLYLRRASARLFLSQMQGAPSEQERVVGGEKSGGSGAKEGTARGGAVLRAEPLLIPFRFRFTSEELEELEDYFFSPLESLGILLTRLDEKHLAVQSSLEGMDQEMMRSFLEHLLQARRHLDVQKGEATGTIRSEVRRFCMMELAKSAEMRQYKFSSLECRRLLSTLADCYERDRQLRDTPSSREESPLLSWGMSPLGKDFAALLSQEEMIERYFKRRVERRFAR